MYIIHILMFVLALLTGSAIVLHLLTAITAKETTSAIIVNIKKRVYIGHDSYRGRIHYMDAASYVPVFKFFVNEKSYIVESAEGYTKNKYTIGQKIKISYRKKNPNDACIYENRKHIIKSSIIYLILLFMAIIFCVLRVMSIN